MGVADELCDELFRWIDQQEKCADHLMALAIKLEEMREKITKSQFGVNTTTVLASATLVGSGIATLLTGGLAAPLLATVAGITATAGTVTSLGISMVESWKSSETMKNAKKTVEKIEMISNNITRLRKKLAEECEIHNLNFSSSDEVQYEITARILTAMAKRSGRHLSSSQLRCLLRINDMHIDDRDPGQLNRVIQKVINLSLVVFGLSFIAPEKRAVAKGAQYSTQLFGKTVVSSATKAVFKGTGQVAGGVLGLVFSVPDLINNCEELIKNQHQTEASTKLKIQASEIREAVKNVKKQLKELQEMLNQIPEIEYHIHVAQEMLGSQTYTRGTMCVEHKKTQKHDGKIQNFILIATVDMGLTRHASTGNQKSDQNKNKGEKCSQTTKTKVTKPVVNQQKECQGAKVQKEKEKKKEQTTKFRLPSIIYSNVRSLGNKMKEFTELMVYEEYCRDIDIICITETWMNENSTNVDLDGYEVNRLDRVKQLTGKSRGGGTVMYVNKDFATDVEVEILMITPDYELMALSIIPHGHPEGAPPLIFILVYVPGPNFGRATTEIANVYFDAVEKSGVGHVFLLGDFNQCDIPCLFQYVTCPTRKDEILDKCFGDEPGAYRSECRPPLGRSDHNVIYLIPKDKENAHQECNNEHTQPNKEDKKATKKEKK